MESNASPSYWETVLIHEAGHAVAALALRDLAADIFVKQSMITEFNVEPYSGSHRLSFDWVDIHSGRLDPLNTLMICAAGAQAEAVCLGITESNGFKNDRKTIDEIRYVFEIKSSEGRLQQHLNYVSEDRFRALQAELPQHRMALGKIIDEIDSGYSLTAAVIRENKVVLEVIAAAALESVQQVGENNLSHGLVLLSAERIREIWNTRKRDHDDI